MAEAETEQDGGGVASAERQDTLTVTDNRTGETYEVPIEDGTVKAMDFRGMKVDENDFGLMTYDPAYTNTASCRSEITFIDGEAGVLQHRGYSIEDLCEHATYLEVAYLLVCGELPTQDQLDEWVHEITIHTYVHENMREFLSGFRYDAHPMGMLLGCVGALSTFYPDAKAIDDEGERHMAAVRLIAKVPTLAAFAYRHSLGLPYIYPDNDLSYPGNFLSMLYKMTEVKYEPDPRLERALDVLWILHADHEQNCSTSAVRAVGSSEVDPYSAAAAGVAALYGPLHGGANEAVLRMLDRIEKVENIPDFLQGVKDKKEKPDGLRPPRVQELRPARADHQEERGGGLRGHRQEPEDRDRRRAREAGARGRLLHRAQAVPERRLLLGPDLRGAADPDRHVHGDVRDPADLGVDLAVARDGQGRGDEDRAPAPDLHGRARPRLRADRPALRIMARLNTPTVAG